MIQFYSPPKLVKRLAFLFLLIVGINQLSRAQAPTISYPTAAQNLSRGIGDSLLTVKLVFNGVCSGTVRLGLPASVTYIPGSVTKTSGTASVTIAESSIADLSKPTFSISGVAAIGDEITFTVRRRAGCGSLATAKDSVYFVAGAGCSDGSEIAGTVNTYNIFAPTLPITPAAALTGAVVGSTYSRTTVVTNGGNGPTDTVRFYIVYPSAGIANSSGTNAVTANGVSFTPSSTNGDTLFYKFAGATLFGGNSLLTSGETVTVVEPIRVLKCNTTTTYGACWGRTDAAVCEKATATSSMTMAVGVPDFTHTTTGLLAYTDNACSPHDTRFTITNTGTGNAVAATMYNVVFTQAQNDMDPASRYTLSNYRIGTTTITPTFTGALGSQLMTVDLAALALTTDPDGAGVGVDDIDGDGFYDDLAPGKTLTFTIQFQINDFRTAYCDPRNGRQVYWRWITRIGHSNMCSSTIVYPKPVNNDALIALGIDGPSLVINDFSPVSVAAGTPFTMQSKVTNFSAGLGNYFSLWPTSSTKRRWVHRFTMPAGVSLSGTGNPTVDGIATTATTSGSVVSITVDGQTQPGEITIDFLYTCGTGGLITIPYTLEFIDDRGSPGCNINNELFCYDHNITVIGCTPCLIAAPTVGIPTIRRDDNSYGYTSNALTTRVAYTVVPAKEQKQALYLDTVRMDGYMVQNGTATNLFHQLQLNKTTTPSDKLTPLSAQVTIKRGATVLSTCTLTSSSISTAEATPTLSSFEWDLTSCLPVGGLLAGDSALITSKYVVSSKNLPAQSFEKATGTNYTFYNKDLSGGKLVCNSFPIDLYLAHYYYSNNNEGVNIPINGCGEQAIATIVQYSTLSGDYPFTNEIRPISRYKNISIKVPLTVTVTKLTTSGSIIVGTGGTYLSTAPGNTTVDNGDGTKTVTFNNDGTFAINQGEGYMVYQIFGFAGCDYVSPSVITTTHNLRRTYYAENVAYGTLDVPTPIDSNINIQSGSKIFLNKPSVTVQNNTGTVQGVSVNQQWDVQINSVGTSTAPYVWMALEQGLGSGNITVDSVKLLPSGTLISPTSTYNTNDKWYQISTAGLASSTSQQARVFFRYTSCAPDSILLKSGWNCGAYPTPNPIGNTCALQTYLKVDPQASQVQLSVLRQPGGGSSINLCTTDSALLVLNSAQAANLVNPYVTFFPPAGLTLVTPIQVEYPRGSGDYQNATVTSLPGGGYQINLNAHTGIGTSGMFGTANASPSYVPLGGDREAKIKMNFTTDCSYTSGTSFTFNAYGSRPCGAPAIDNGIAATTSKLDITGASAAGGAGVTISFGGAATTLGCGSTVVTLSLITTPTSLGTTAGDTMTYTLPVGMGYAGNLTSGYSATVTGGAGSPTIVKVAMPTGVAAGTAINFNFDVVPQGGGCGSVNIMGAYQRRIASLFCGATACASSSVVISTATSPNITLVKPSLVISNLNILDTTAWRQAAYPANHIRVFYSNNGTQAYAANTDTIEFFCNAAATVPFAKMPLTKALAIGASDSDEYYLMMPLGACSPGDVIVSRIQTRTAAGTPQCLCSPSSFVSAGIGLPLTFTKTSINAQNCAVNIGWAYSESGSDKVASFIIERSSNGAQYSPVASVSAISSNYVDVTPSSGKWYYRIKATGLDGKTAYSNTLIATTSQCVGNSVKVYPNPASNLLQIVLQGASNNNAYELVDALGRTIVKGSLNSNSNNNVDVSGVLRGSYIIKVITDDNVTTHQVQIVK